MTSDRDKLTYEIYRQCLITGKGFVEKNLSITVNGGPKYQFTIDGELKSIIINGRSYGPDGEIK
jgi:hypothetical protein